MLEEHGKIWSKVKDLIGKDFDIYNVVKRCNNKGLPPEKDFVHSSDNSNY